jgi:hypothetical protein
LSAVCYLLSAICCLLSAERAIACTVICRILPGSVKGNWNERIYRYQNRFSPASHFWCSFIRQKFVGI